MSRYTLRDEQVVLSKREHDSLTYRLASLEAELRHANKHRGFWKWFLQRPAAVLVALMMMGVLGAGAWGANISGFFTGNDYLAKPDLVKLGYVVGVCDAFNTTVDHSEFRRCFKQEMTIGQVQAIVDKFLRDNPQYRHLMMASLIRGAVVESCPQ